MEARAAALPELDALRLEAVTAPVRRPHRMLAAGSGGRIVIASICSRLAMGALCCEAIAAIWLFTGRL
jgi:hypothetical protein